MPVSKALLKPIPELSITTNHMIEMIYGRWQLLLSRYNQFALPSKASPRMPVVSGEYIENQPHLLL